MRKVLGTLGPVLLMFITILYKPIQAQNVPVGASGRFDLKNGDRVVFLGNSLFENDFQYGWLELLLTTRFPDRDVTFRNLGWSGDNVWGDGRSTFTNPPTAYQHLMQDITKAAPTIVFLAYGGVEAQEGQAGLSHFKEGLNNLLNKIDSLGAKTILLSTIPVVSSDTAVNVSKRNEDLALYSTAIAQVASARSKQFIDIYQPIQEMSKKETIIENGVHLNETGYFYLASVLEKGLRLKREKETISITVSKHGPVTSSPAKITDPGKDMTDFKFTIEEKFLPFSMPGAASSMAVNPTVLKITGLKKGVYSLDIDDNQVFTASSQRWEQGVEIKRGPSFIQAAEIRDMILKKNELHFFQYRPINETYIIGFRAYEQGKHVKDLEDQNILIKWLEGQIAIKRMPKKTVYKLSSLRQKVAGN
ncbi:GDSL-type esterase/lipase family protein [Dyadobacter sp. LHD-138]|uniref:GDSL-type esterase/lipase family protein n=1 Tax=Dyadobacter sp. LHD-138 TaxID=3071413 RepID=UPI0027E20A8B|nr:GDSL-type esterase/lipase family protein [Dyadobacter sp. LHD-138]MDQ6479443.1 GDSL-type esterase/lipase family protein [Dyadobacter sp. LHD-138]